RYFNKILTGLTAIVREIVILPNLNVIPPEIYKRKRILYCYFKGAISATNGTHIAVRV
ncbi:hypothetical protein C7212DRAFT_148836, partial [Tuber magnatum]